MEEAETEMEDEGQRNVGLESQRNRRCEVRAIGVNSEGIKECGRDRDNESVSGMMDTQRQRTQRQKGRTRSCQERDGGG